MNDRTDRLLEILTAQRDLYAEMLKLSENKRDVIVKNDIGELDRIVKREEAILVKIGELERNRRETLDKIAEALNITAEELSSSKILESVSPQDQEKFNAVVNDLTEILKKLGDVNETNSKLIKFNLDYINNIINKVVMGDGKNATYTDKGNSAVKQQKNIIDQTI